jgi:hypothetical protein
MAMESSAGPANVVPLSMETIGGFLSSAAAQPHQQAGLIRKEIARVADDSKIVDALAAWLLSVEGAKSDHMNGPTGACTWSGAAGSDQRGPIRLVAVSVGNSWQFFA